MTATKAGSSAFSLLDLMSTISPCSSLADGKPDSISWSAFLASPTFVSVVSRNVVPKLLPRITAAITNASHPKVAVFQWLALHRPMRAAMLVERLRGDNLGLLVKGGWCKSKARSGPLEPKCGQQASRGAAGRTES